jgi:hypothetical protein
MVDRCVWGADNAGSIPVTPTILQGSSVGSSRRLLTAASQVRSLPLQLSRSTLLAQQELKPAHVLLHAVTECNGSEFAT